MYDALGDERHKYEDPILFLFCIVLITRQAIVGKEVIPIAPTN